MNQQTVYGDKISKGFQALKKEEEELLILRDDIYDAERKVQEEIRSEKEQLRIVEELLAPVVAKQKMLDRKEQKYEKAMENYSTRKASIAKILKEIIALPE